MANLGKQNKGGTFHMSAQGHELVGAIAGLELIAKEDHLSHILIHRDQALPLALGCDLLDIFGVFLGRTCKHQSSGRMMPYHYSHRDLRIICQSSPVGSQFLQAVGRALGIKRKGASEVVYVSGGEGSTSQGDFHEALNFSCIHNLPIIFMIQDNGLAISVPVEEQTAGGSIVNVAKGYAGYERLRSPDQEIVMMDAINNALTEELQRDPNTYIFGQDVAGGKGGVFGLTRGLTDKFGKERCFNSPLAESTIVGVSLGLSAGGEQKAISEIQFSDYIWTGMNQLVNEIASFQWRSNGEWTLPLVIRIPCGGYIQGGPYHSQSLEAYLSHCPGLKIVMPSNAYDAKALLKAAIRDPNPVIFLEHKLLYRQRAFSARKVGDDNFLLPFGKAATTHAGDDITVVSWGYTLVMAHEVAERLSRNGHSVEVIDLRTIVPLDKEAILNSVKKTGKLLIVHEDTKNGGFGAEISAMVNEEIFDYLDAPIQRVCALNTPVGYSKVLENATLPQKEDIEKAMLKLINY